MRKSVLLFSTLLVIALLGSSKVNAQGLYVPSAYGAWGNTVYGGMTMSFPGIYDGGDSGVSPHMAAGIGLGNPVTNVGLQAQINRYSVVSGGRNSLSLQVSRYLGKGWSAALGADNLVRWGGSKVPTSPESYYASFSQKLKYVKSASSFASRLSYTLGIGTGRYAHISPSEKAADMGLKITDSKQAGTVLFGALTVDIMKWLDFTAEWHGRNAAAGIGLNFNIWKFPTRAIAGVTDLTGFTGDGVRPFAGLVMAYQFKDVEWVKLNTDDIEKKMDEQHKEMLEKTDELQKEHKEIIENQKALQDKLANLEQQVQTVQTAQKQIAEEGYNNAAANSYGAVKAANESLQDRGTGNYVVVYSRRSLNNAQQMVKSLQNKGVNSEITQNKIKSWYHVYTHLYSPSDLQTALKESSAQRRNGYVGAWVLVK